MPTLIGQSSLVEAVDPRPKQIREYIGRVNTRHEGLSVVRTCCRRKVGRNRGRDRSLKNLRWS